MNAWFIFLINGEYKIGILAHGSIEAEEILRKKLGKDISIEFLGIDTKYGRDPNVIHNLDTLVKVSNVFLSYGMHDVPKYKQEQTRHYLIEKTCKILNKSVNEIRFISNQDCPGKENDGRLYYLGHAIQLMDKCDYIIFAKDWQEHKGCCIEHQVATLYGIEILSD